jgi:glycine betaine/proline transport system substrate-binding protein
MQKKTSKWQQGLCSFLLVLTLFILSACSTTAPTPAGSGESAAQQEAAPAEAKPAPKDFTVKLAANPWTASALNVNVAKILLEEKLGYTVEIIEIDENAQWPALATGDLHASLEVWPSGHADNVAEYIEKQKVVENGGLIGPIGKIGWYIPTYMLTEHPDLATWEGFKNPENAKLFATAETGDKGQFLQGDPSWVYYDADIIKNLQLNLQIVQVGSEDAVKAAVDAAYGRQEPVLFYFWTPHSIHARYELTEVKLPDYSEECYAKAAEGGVACDYPADALFKVFWSGLKDAAPEAHNFLAKMDYTTKDQIGMIAAVELDGKSYEEAARAWIDGNEATWRKWLQ